MSPVSIYSNNSAACSSDFAAKLQFFYYLWYCDVLNDRTWLTLSAVGCCQWLLQVINFLKECCHLDERSRTELWYMKLMSQNGEIWFIASTLTLSSPSFWNGFFHSWIWTCPLTQIWVSVLKQKHNNKQCRSWWDGSWRAVSSGSTLLA